MMYMKLTGNSCSLMAEHLFFGRHRFDCAREFDILIFCFLTHCKLLGSSHRHEYKTPSLSKQTISNLNYLTIIIPRARMGYESIAHEAEDRMGY